jgi:chromosome segregation ATPase
MQLRDVRERIGTLTRMIDGLGDKLARDTGRPEEEMEKDRAHLSEYERRLEERKQERKTLEEEFARIATSL